MLDEKSFALIAKNEKSVDVASHHEYYVFKKSSVLHKSCDITHDQGLRVEFGRITEISDILIELTVIGKRLPSQ